MNYSGGCSALAAMSLKGIEMVSIHEDIIDGEAYLKILEYKILPLMNPYPQEKSVLFNDNVDPITLARVAMFKNGDANPPLISDQRKLLSTVNISENS